MPPPYTTILARVKQKRATESAWIAAETLLGPVLDGEQAFVVNDAGDPVNFKLGDGIRLFSDLPYWITYYSNVTSQKVLSYLNKNINITISSVFRAASELQGIAIYNTSGTPITLNIGTTNGGSQLGQIIVPVGDNFIGLRKIFNAPQDVYLTGLSGHSYSLYLLYFQYDEAPVVPPAGSGSSTLLYVKGTMGMFIPIYPGHENDIWDFTTGLGKPNTGYDNCALMGTNALPDMTDYVPSGYGVGDTLLAEVGSNGITLAEAQMPKFKVPLFLNYGNNLSHDRIGANDAVATLAVRGSDASNYEMAIGHAASTVLDDPTSYLGKSGPVGNGQSINIQNKGRKVLFFAAIS